MKISKIIVLIIIPVIIFTAFKKGQYPDVKNTVSLEINRNFKMNGSYLQNAHLEADDTLKIETKSGGAG